MGLTLTLMKVSPIYLIPLFFLIHVYIHVCIFTEKHTFNGLTDLMTKVAAAELAGLDPEVKECYVIYLPQVKTHFYTQLIACTFLDRVSVEV